MNGGFFRIRLTILVKLEYSYNKEIEILLNYLPEQLSESDIQKIIEETINEVGATSMKDMGKVMASITPKVKGRADNKIVSGYVKNLLQNK